MVAWSAFTGRDDIHGVVTRGVPSPACARVKNSSSTSRILMARCLSLNLRSQDSVPEEIQLKRAVRPFGSRENIQPFMIGRDSRGRQRRDIDPIRGSEGIPPDSGAGSRKDARRSACANPHAPLEESIAGRRCFDPPVARIPHLLRAPPRRRDSRRCARDELGRSRFTHLRIRTRTIVGHNALLRDAELDRIRAGGRETPTHVVMPGTAECRPSCACRGGVPSSPAAGAGLSGGAIRFRQGRDVLHG